MKKWASTNNLTVKSSEGALTCIMKGGLRFPQDGPQPGERYKGDGILKVLAGTGRDSGKLILDTVVDCKPVKKKTQLPKPTTSRDGLQKIYTAKQTPKAGPSSKRAAEDSPPNPPKKRMRKSGSSEMKKRKSGEQSSEPRKKKTSKGRDSF